MNANRTWYLGLDFGTTHLRGTLIDVRNGQQYPLNWQLTHSQQDSSATCPTVAYLNLTGKPEAPSSSNRFAIGAEALAMGQRSAAPESTAAHQGLLLEDFKPYLNLAIPYYGQIQRGWEPTLQVYGRGQVSLYWLQLALKALLANLNPSESSAKVVAVGLPRDRLSTALASLEGVVMSCPAGWSDAYRFNLREAILEVGLVEREGQIFFVEESIAVLLGLSDWEAGKGPGRTASVLPSPSGLTLMIHSGAATTELAVVELPSRFKDLKHSDFGLRNFPYGGNAFVQDIFYQLLYPQWLPQQDFLAELEVEFPQAGTPDLAKREPAQSELREFSGGRRLLATAKRVWLILQKQEELSAQLGTQTWKVTRRELEERAIAPFLACFNRELNALLSQQGIDPGAIAQIVCSGGMASALFPFLQQGLQPKFPQALWLQAPEPQETSLVAVGLARLPFFPKVLDAIAHQYSDYFLLRELLQVFPNRAVTVDEILQSLERRGINTRNCSRRILNYLQGELPAGLIPTTTNARCLDLSSQQNRDYQGITSAPLFEPEDLYRYRLNRKQSQRLNQYLAALISGAQQQWDDPLDFNLSTFTDA